VREASYALPARTRTERVSVVSSLRAVSPVAWLLGLFALSTLVYVVLGTQHVLENLDPDEVLYAKLSQSFARGDGLAFRGVGVGYPPLWPVVLSPVWYFGSAVEGYQIGKVLGALLASTVVFPVWLLGRELGGPRLALVPAALCVLGAWMETTALIVSDNLAYPLAVASLACIVMAVRDTRSRWVLASLAFAIPATLTRTQMLALPVILVVAVALDVARQPRGARWARVQARPRALWVLLVAGVVALLAAYAADQSLTGYRLLSYPVSFTQALGATGRHAISAINMFAFVPIAAAGALMARAANWRDDAVGPVLVTLTAAIVVLLPLLGFYEAYASHYPVDRYGMYLAPLAFLALVLAPGRIGKRAALVSALVVAGLMALTPRVRSELQQPALFGSQRRIDALGLFGGHQWLGFIVVALVVGGAGMLALTWHRRGRGLAAATTLVAAVMVTQAATSQAVQIELLKEARPVVAPRELDWVDRHVGGPVGVLDLNQQQTLSGNVDLYTDFYNKRVDRMYALVENPYRCATSLARDGVLTQAGGPTCAPWPRYLVVEKSRVFPTLAGQHVLASTPVQGTLIEIPPAPPRVVGIVQPPCEAGTCAGLLEVVKFGQSPGSIAITFGAASAPHALTLAGGRQWPLPAGREATLRLPVAGGFTQLKLPVSWSSPEGAPALRSVVLESAGSTTRLY
jgi:hypothetical protein